ncbi:uncharacterized protein BX663DRAFT_519457 [Cokeromyces recurvatus]|uniref:uncharacterized protein n=1 Tax=Cokeromyces recurvatus TaxID=90255 RepID=UPI002220A543|nr:uncharacterized protein BX663DRAFT_519457 [Cokeromyces recurvatus]KAI7900051.1 hypothetical protein BX663DRAFT_519457 [Cokeromyces recurvatus]
MKVRITPCTECRKYRRKCIRDNLSNRCTRCIKFDKACVQPIKNGNGNSSLLDDKDDLDLVDLKHNVQQLEQAIQQFENQLNHLRMIRNNDNSKRHDALLADPMIQNLFYQWKFKIKNGIFEIETGIRNVGDLLSYNKQSISYLSPLSSSGSRSSSSNSNDTSSLSSKTDIYCGESTLLLNFSLNNKEGTTPFMFRLFAQFFKHSNFKTKDSNAFLLPRAFIFEPFLVVNQLVEIYFKCLNVYHPFLHEATFRARFLKLQNPLADIVTLCICCNVCSSVCRHVPYDARDKRSLADFFYSNAKSILLDQFDQIEKRLENVICINLLSQYLHMTIRYFEYRRLISMAYQICLDLKDYYNLSSERVSENNDHSSIAENAKQFTTNIDKTLFIRHLTIISMQLQLINYITGEAIDAFSLCFPSWKFLSDEPEFTQKLMQSRNWVLTLFNHPFISKFMEQLCNIHFGKTCTLSFESIVRLEAIFKEWASTLPDDFRICDDLKDFDKCKKAIDETSDLILLITFLGFHSFHINFYAYLLQPIAHGPNEQILNYVEQYSLNQSLQSCYLLNYTIQRIFALKRNQSACVYECITSHFIFRAIDILGILALSSNPNVTKAARETMKICLNIIETFKFIHDLHASSKVQLITTTGIHEFINGSVVDLDHYSQYPYPWIALIYDVSYFIGTT